MSLYWLLRFWHQCRGTIHLRNIQYDRQFHPQALVKLVKPNKTTYSYICPTFRCLFHCDIKTWPSYIKNNVCTRVTTCFNAHKRAIKIIRECPEKQFVTRVHTLFYFLHDITNLYMMIKTAIFTHRPMSSLARFSFCWWRHNRLLMSLQWPDNHVNSDISLVI